MSVVEVPFKSGWEMPAPIASSLPLVEKLEAEMLPEALRGYVFDVADRQQSVPDFVAVAALTGLAAIVGNRIRVAPKQNDDWIEVPNLWGAIIGPPSAMLSWRACAPDSRRSRGSWPRPMSGLFRRRPSSRT